MVGRHRPFHHRYNRGFRPQREGVEVSNTGNGVPSTDELKGGGKFICGPLLYSDISTTFHCNRNFLRRNLRPAAAECHTQIASKQRGDMRPIKT